MYMFVRRLYFLVVALLAEGVDRNIWLLLGLVALYCRPPHGGRG